MSEQWDSDLARRKFAEERSHRDAQVSNENMRATAQAVILINGGAATAVLAYLSKDKLDPQVLRVISWCLVGYALGVLSGAGMMLGMVRYTDYYNFFWRLTAHPEITKDPSYPRKKAGRWWHLTIGCFYASMVCFVLASTVVAWSLYRSQPPQQIQSGPTVPGSR